MILYLLQGLALIVFGIRFLRKGLDRLLGSRLSSWLATMTQNRWRAFGAGIAAGTVAPSSTALSVLSLQMLRTGRLGPEGTLAVLLGGSVGMTVTVQLLASGVTNEAGYLLIAGVVGFQLLRREVYRGIGQCLFALGLLFLGLHEIGRGAALIAADAPARGVLALMLQSPGLTLISAGLSAILLQSSTAAIGLAIGLSAGGIFPVQAMIPWIIGTNLGLSVTSLLVGWKSWDGRRLGAASLFVRAVVALPLFLLSGAAAPVLEHLPFSLPREIALLQTGFNLLAGLVAIPFLDPVTRIIRLMVAPEPVEQVGQSQEFMDEGALDSPSLALAMATRQMQRMADRIGTMLGQYWIAETTRNTDLAKKIQQEENEIDAFNTRINDYLSRIGEGMSQEDAQWQFALLAFANELESAGDIIDKNLCDSIIKRAADFVAFAPCEMEILCQVRETIFRRLQIASGFLSWRDLNSAREFLDGKEKFNDWCRSLEREHFQRLKAREPGTLGSSAYFLDILNSFRRINSHISSIGYAFEA